MVRIQVTALQFDSEIMQFDKNVATADTLLESYHPTEKLSLLVLPELSLTGYFYRSRAEIEPYLEPRDGRSVHWAKKTAAKTGSHVVIGFPEKHESNVYNTAALVAPSGDVLGYYRKTHMFRIDKEWGCSPSPQGMQAMGPFESFPIKVQLGICMDLDPRENKEPWEKLEYASSAKENNAQLAVVLTAWPASDTPAPPGYPDNILTHYWLMRQPFPIPTVYSNRIGSERGIIYAGTSMIKQADGKYKTLNVDATGLLSDVIEIT